MRVNICGCGPSIRLFKDKRNKSIGVNDVASYTKIPLYGLVVLDPVTSFSAKRRSVIVFYSKFQ